jgi:hypothetical protein
VQILGKYTRVAWDLENIISSASGGEARYFPLRRASSEAMHCEALAGLVCQRVKDALRPYPFALQPMP